MFTPMIVRHLKLMGLRAVNFKPGTPDEPKNQASRFNVKGIFNSIFEMGQVCLLKQKYALISYRNFSLCGNDFFMKSEVSFSLLMLLGSLIPANR